MYTIKQMKITRPYTIEFQFNDETVAELNFEEKLHQWSQGNRESLAGQLLDLETFNSVRWDPEWETIYWPNGFDLCPDCIYHWSTGVPFPDYVLEYDRKQEKTSLNERELVNV